ncbi:MAG: LacI family DNA-binding transcriptional regulator [Eubacterium sp.]|nr:LacI family DNA-binding transcriptional regulator [Eubacterium sp.]
MKVTIQDVANHAGVSIATVSHVLNKTRYVRPELVEQVERAIRETGYVVKKETSHAGLLVGRLSKIAFVIPDLNGTIYGQLVNQITMLLKEQGYTLAIYITNDNLETERNILLSLITDKSIAGIFLAPCRQDDKVYRKIKKSRIPFVCVERGLKDPEIDCVLADNEHAVYLGTRHLINSGHMKIGILLWEKSKITPEEERLNGYIRAMKEHACEINPKYIQYVITGNPNRDNIFELYDGKDCPTAFIACSNTLTHALLHDIDERGLNCPGDVSVIGFGEDAWSDIFNPPLTILAQRIDDMAEKAVDVMMNQIKEIPVERPIKRIPIEFRVRKSTRAVNRGPFGENAITPEQITLTETEALQVKKGNYKVAIAFHSTNTYWTSLQEKAIRDTLEEYNVQVISMMNANFDPKLQIAQLEALRIQKPDAIIGLPVDEHVTASKFKELSNVTKLILIGNLPKGFSPEDYYSCVSVNERENGQNAGVILGEYFKSREYVNIGMLTHGVPFQMTQQRDESAEQVIRENYRNLHIVSKKSFVKIKNAYQACKDMITEHPEIEGLYVSWEGPALEAMRALEELNRTDISIATVDLDVKVATYMSKGKMIRGLSVQKPYEQGQAVAMVTMQALLGKRDFKYVGVQPMRVFPHELAKVWRDVTKTQMPDFEYDGQML